MHGTLNDRTQSEHRCFASQVQDSASSSSTIPRAERRGTDTGPLLFVTPWLFLHVSSLAGELRACPGAAPGSFHTILMPASYSVFDPMCLGQVSALSLYCLHPHAGCLLCSDFEAGEWGVLPASTVESKSAPWPCADGLISRPLSLQALPSQRVYQSTTACVTSRH